MIKDLFHKIGSFFKGLWKALDPYKKNIIYPLLKILGIIIVCAVLVRVMSGNETLSDYAEKNPEIAYQSDSEAK